MTTSQEGRSFIESCEGVKLKAYQDGRGIWTCGVGHTLGVKEGDTCTPQEADAWLAEDLAAAEGAVNRLVKVPLSQPQFDALVSLCFNIGQGNFAESTVLRKLNQSDYQSGAQAFLMWSKISGETSQGLLNRRTAERAMFLSSAGVS